jgi:predicted HNH restriction endonuclease
VERWGPGGKGSGNFYSPANVLNNYLKEKTRNALLVDKRFVPSTKGWGAAVVNQWQFVAAEDLPASEEDWQFAEGKQILKLHLFRERDAGVRKALLRTRAGTGLSCDMCGTTGDHLDAGIRDAMFEAHHANAPISDGERSTKKDDMALLCACCHRLVHRLIRTKGEWVSIKQAKGMLIRA